MFKKIKTSTRKLIILSAFIFAMYSCSNHESDCIYLYSSNFSNVEIALKLSIEKQKDNLIYIYSDKERGLSYSIKYNKPTETLTYIENGLESRTILLGSKSIGTQNGTMKINCYFVDNPEILGENLTLFFNPNIGITIHKLSSATRDLIKKDQDSIDIRNLVESIKCNSKFYNLDSEFCNRNLPDTIETK